MGEEQRRVVEAIRRLRERVRWRTGRDVLHLSKRIELEHLPVGATLAEYEALIIRVVNIPTAEVFVYRWGNVLYPTVVTTMEGVQWLVMMGLDGIMETAFPPEDPETYLADRRFARLGTLEDLGL